MTATTCPACGAPIAPGATFCTYCGAGLTGSPAAGTALASAPPSGPSPVGWPASSSNVIAPPPRRRSRFLVVLVIVVVVFLVAGVVGYLFLYAGPPPVRVGEIDIYSPDDVCGLHAVPVYFAGFNSSTGASQVYDFGMPNFNGSACTVRTVTTNTTGFSVSGAQVPLTILAGANASLNVTIQSPSSPYNGNLALILE